MSAGREWWLRIRWACLAMGAVLLLFTAGIVWPGVFVGWGVNAIDPIFSDLIAILAAGEARQLGWDAYAHNPLDPFNRPHVYGPWWLVTGDLGLVRSDARWLGPLLAIGFLGVATALLKPKSMREVLLVLPLLASPPVLLAMERGNNDLVVFLLLVLAAWGIGRSSWIRAAVAGTAVVLATGLKIYPVAALPMMAAKRGARKPVVMGFAITLLALLVLGWQSWAVYRQVMAMAPEPMTIFGYGLKLSYYVFLTLPDYRFWLGVGALPVLLLVGVALWRWRRGFLGMVPTVGMEAGCFVSGALCWGACYVSTISFPYRLVLLLLPAVLCFRSRKDSAPELRVLGVGIGLLLWSLWAKEHLLVLSADESTFTGPPMAWIALGMEHALAFGVSAMLAVGLVGWGWRRWSAFSN